MGRSEVGRREPRVDVAGLLRLWRSANAHPGRSTVPPPLVRAGVRPRPERRPDYPTARETLVGIGATIPGAGLEAPGLIRGSCHRVRYYRPVRSRARQRLRLWIIPASPRADPPSLGARTSADRRRGALVCHPEPDSAAEPPRFLISRRASEWSRLGSGGSKLLCCGLSRPQRSRRRGLPVHTRLGGHARRFSHVSGGVLRLLCANGLDRACLADWRLMSSR